jgi:hypothetical protein
MDSVGAAVKLFPSERQLGGFDNGPPTHEVQGWTVIAYDSSSSLMLVDDHHSEYIYAARTS